MQSAKRTQALCGSMTALVTPFRGGAVDWTCLERLVERQIEGGTDWLVALGTTGETPTLSQTERRELLEAVLRTVSGRCPVMAGTGSSSTRETVERTRQAAAAGADAVLVVAPSYNRPTPEGLFRHFTKVAESVELPIVLYNVPSRTAVNIDNDLVVRLHERFPHIKAIKDATGRVDNVTALRIRCGIDILCGDDSLIWPFLALGAVGAISVISNLCPTLVKSLMAAAGSGLASDAVAIHHKVFDLAVGLGRFGPNPLPIKCAMALAGLLEEEFRLPLCPLAGQERTGIQEVLQRHEILEGRSRHPLGAGS